MQNLITFSLIIQRHSGPQSVGQSWGLFIPLTSSDLSFQKGIRLKLTDSGKWPHRFIFDIGLLNFFLPSFLFLFFFFLNKSSEYINFFFKVLYMSEIYSICLTLSDSFLLNSFFCWWTQVISTSWVLWIILQ